MLYDAIFWIEIIYTNFNNYEVSNIDEPKPLQVVSIKMQQMRRYNIYGN